MKMLRISKGNSRKSFEVREKSGKNEIVLANVLENFDNVHFISIFCQRFFNVTFCYTAYKLESGENILGQGKVMEKSGKIKT